jgi:TPR repeat protein
MLSVKIKYMNKLFFLVVLGIVSVGCRQSSSQVQSAKVQSTAQPSIDYSEMPLDELKQTVIDGGDAEAYNALLYRCNPEQFFLYSLIWSNKYSYPMACFYAYSLYISDFSKDGDISTMNWNKLDDVSKQQMIDFMKEGVSSGYPQAEEDLGEAYIAGKGIKKDVRKGRCLIKQSDRFFWNGKYMDSILQSPSNKEGYYIKN